jgi:hypothetical protein
MTDMGGGCPKLGRRKEESEARKENGKGVLFDSQKRDLALCWEMIETVIF